MNTTSVRRAAIPTVAALALGLGLSGCGAANEQPSNSSGNAQGAAAQGMSGTLSGAGSTAQQAAQEAWRAGFQTANPNVTVNYDPVGSGSGVSEFLAGGVSFAGSDAYLSTAELAQSKKVCGGQTAIEVPDYVSPIAIVYNVPGVKNLQLDAKTLAAIFNGTITQWNDPAIKADNPGVNLPAQRITPVHRSDDSGTTENFTDYLSQASQGAWGHPASETWPVKSGEGADGTSGVVQAVTNGAGTIGYADASQAGQLSVAKIKVGNTYVAPTAAGAAKDLDLSTQVKGRSANDMAISLNRTTTNPDAYPLVLVSYLIGCPSYGSAHTADLVQSYFGYVLSGNGQQAAAKTAGSAPLSSSFSQKAGAQVQDISAK